jgi:hypothetical protein
MCCKCWPERAIPPRSAVSQFRRGLLSSLLLATYGPHTAPVALGVSGNSSVSAWLGCSSTNLPLVLWMSAQVLFLWMQRSSCTNLLTTLASLRSQSHSASGLRGFTLRSFALAAIMCMAGPSMKLPNLLGTRSAMHRERLVPAWLDGTRRAQTECATMNKQLCTEDCAGTIHTHCDSCIVLVA